ncbi:MAG: ABC transporter ATP-binding protein [Pyrobaculum sp.]
MELSYAFRGVDVLRGVSLEVDRGAFIAVTGPNGSGKTTFFRCLLGILNCRGEVAIEGRDPRREADVKTLIGYIPQSLSYPPLTVREVVELHLRLYKSKIGADEVLREFGLEQLQDRSVAKLSGGEKQRLAWALAVSHSPRILILDEPFSNLDAGWREKTRALLGDFKGKSTVLIAVHHLDEIKQYVDGVVEFEGGRIKGVW